MLQVGALQYYKRKLPENILSVAFAPLWTLDYRAPRTRNPAKRRGQLYEARVNKVLAKKFQGQYLPGPVLVARTARGIHRFIPDGILFIGDVMWLVEMKFTHTQDAWHQLWNIYGPLVEAAFKGYRLRGYIEVVNSMGPQDSRLPIFDDVDRCLSHHSSIWLAPERWLR